MENEIEANDAAEQVTSSHREQRLVLGSSGGQEPEQEQCGTTHYAGCACHEQGWKNKWKAAIEMAARAELERDMWKANHDNQVAIKRIIAARPDLKERAPMVEKLMAERNRAQAHSIRQHERIKQLESVPTKEMLAALLERVKSGDEQPEAVAEYRHLAGEISAWGAKFAEAMRRRDERTSRKRISSENS